MKRSSLRPRRAPFFKCLAEFGKSHKPSRRCLSVSATERAIPAKKKHARLPMVLCHGLLGFDMFGGTHSIPYWRGIRACLEALGSKVLIARVPPTLCVKDHASILRDRIDGWSKEGLLGEDRKVNLVGHSMGGLDGRYLISHLPSDRFQVASLTTIATLHRGSSIADVFLSRPPLSQLSRLLFLTEGELPDLTPAGCAEFNQRTPDRLGVEYFSYSAKCPDTGPVWYNPMKYTWDYLREVEGANDGLVSVASAKWGRHLRTLEADHVEVINWNVFRSAGNLSAYNQQKDDDSGSKLTPQLDALEFYREISAMLHDAGF